MTPTLLTIESDPNLLSALRAELDRGDFRLLVEKTGAEGLNAARAERPDLLLVGPRLPDLDGVELVRRLRRTGTTPVIALMTACSIEAKVAALEAGANDCVVLPLPPGELAARVRVQLRRVPTENWIDVGGLEVYPQRRLCRVGGRDVPLSAKQFDLLLLLAQNAGRIVTRELIREKLWGGDLPDDSGVVEVHIANLRDKLRDAQASGLLRTVRGFGYALGQHDPSGRAAS